MKTFVTLALTLVLTASTLIGCGCTNQNTDNAPAPTVLPTNEEMWNTTESTSRATTENTTVPRNTEGTSGTKGETTDQTTETGTAADSGSTTAESGATTATTEGAMERSARRMMPGTR